MLSLHCTALGFISKNGEYNPEWQVFEKLDIAKSCLAIESNQHKYGDYSLLFSICADDDEQHFNYSDGLNIEFTLVYSNFLKRVS